MRQTGKSKPPRLSGEYLGGYFLFGVCEGNVQLLWLVGAEHGDLLVKHVDDVLVPLNHYQKPSIPSMIPANACSSVD